MEQDYTSEYILDEVCRTLREPDVRKLAALSDDLIDAYGRICCAFSWLTPFRPFSMSP